ncbi:MAG: hypothetical protein ACRERC_05345, partial [Candidatus Binatia bacterium]
RPARLTAGVRRQSVRLSWTALLGFLWLAGCSAFHEPFAATGVAVAPSMSTDISALNIRVRRPELTDPIPPELSRWKSLAPSDVLEFRTSNAEHIIASLSKSDLFASVAYSDGMNPTPTVLVNPVMPPRIRCDGDDVLLPFLTLGLFPAFCERDRGLYFGFLGRHLPDFACAWPQTEMAGWFPVVLSTGFGIWTRAPDEEAFVSHIRSCVRSQSDAFALSANSNQGNSQ